MVRTGVPRTARSAFLNSQPFDCSGQAQSGTGMQSCPSHPGVIGNHQGTIKDGQVLEHARTLCSYIQELGSVAPDVIALMTSKTAAGRRIRYLQGESIHALSGVMMGRRIDPANLQPRHYGIKYQRSQIHRPRDRVSIGNVLRDGTARKRNRKQELCGQKQYQREYTHGNCKASR